MLVALCVFNVNISKQMNIFYGLFQKWLRQLYLTLLMSQTFADLFCMFFITNPLHLVSPLAINYAYKHHTFETAQWKYFCIFQ